MTPPRRTPQTRTVLLAFLVQPDREQYPYGLIRFTGMPSGTVRPILARLVECGWLEVRTDPRDRTDGRPARRWYRLTEEGRHRAAEYTGFPVPPGAPGTAGAVPEPDTHPKEQQ